ncbi:MAG TPA: aconitase family protein, partial [bacterium]|nr:aconitase family protein [bacterium]
SVFPSDRRTREFLAEQGREEDWTELNPDPSASYAARLLLNLDSLEPLAACPHSPDRVRPVRELAGIEVDQVCIGSCTNSSWKDLATAAAVLEGKVVPPRTSLVISPGSRQVMSRLARDGGLDKLISAGARIMENACGPCIGMGQAPPSRGVSLRTYNRNFKGRSGTADAEVYLVSPETAAVSALRGAIVDPREAGTPPVLPASSPVTVDDSMIVPPSAHPETVEVVKGPNISSVPLGERLPVSLEGRILTRVGDNVTTDDIMPAGARILPLRSNIEKISRYVFRDLDPGFVAAADRARRDEAAGVIVGGENYGQGSSREHAALAPRYLGVRAVLARSFARIHRANLINFGILPLVLSAADAETLPPPGAQANFPALREETEAGAPITVDFPGQGRSIRTVLLLSPREREIVLAGGLLNLLKLESGAG